MQRRGSRHRVRSVIPPRFERPSPCSAQAQRPLVIAGSGVWWSDGAAALQAFVEATGVPFYTTPISRGLIPEDHHLAFLNARVRAFSEADLVLVVGTRFNYIIQFGRPPRFAADLKVVQVDVDATQLGQNRPVDVPIVGDARAVLEQLTAEAAGRVDPACFRAWVSKDACWTRRSRPRWTRP